MLHRREPSSYIDFVRDAAARGAIDVNADVHEHTRKFLETGTPPAQYFAKVLAKEDMAAALADHGGAEAMARLQQLAT